MALREEYFASYNESEQVMYGYVIIYRLIHKKYHALLLQGDSPIY